MKEKTFIINFTEDWKEFYYKSCIEIDNKINMNPFFKNFEIKFTTGKRTSKQLAGYWVLIGICRDFFYECGDILTKEDTSDWFLIQLHYYKIIKGMIRPFSLSHKGNITRQMMLDLITYIEVFGAENNIQDCYIKEKEKDILLKKYS